MKKKNISLIVAIIILITIIASAVTFAIVDVNKKTTENCFVQLKNATNSLADNLKYSMESEQTIMSSMALTLGNQEDITTSSISRLLNSFNTSATFLSYFELLTPDNMLTAANGDTLDVTGILDFKEEALKNYHISSRTYDLFNTKDQIVRRAVPVVRHGEKIAVLYGIIKLSEIPKVFNTEIYDGNACVYIVDNLTGNLLMDTLNDNLGNIYDFGDRVSIGDYSFDEMKDDVINGIGGDVALVSKTSGKTVYMHYEPANSNNLSVLVSIDKDTAFLTTNEISNAMSMMVAIIAVSMLAFIVYISSIFLRNNREIKRLSDEDRITGLLNRNAFERFISNHDGNITDSCVCIYMDVNGLHEINNKYGHEAGDHLLKSIGNCLKNQFQYNELYRIGGDEFVVLSTLESESTCLEKILRAENEAKNKGYFVSKGIAAGRNLSSLSEIIKLADERMLEDKRSFYANTANERREMR